MVLEDVEGMQLPQSQDFISKLIPNWVSFVVQLCALLVLIIVVIIFAYKPVKKIIKKRQDYIESNILEAEQNNAQAKSNAMKSEEMIIASEQKASNIIEEARHSALDEQQRIKQETELLVSKMKIEASEDIKRSEIEAKESIRKEMIGIALDASKEVLKREVDEVDNAKLVDDFIRSLDK